MAFYTKGANAERELIQMLWQKGFAAARMAGSGKNVLPMPDLIALGKNKKLIFECKAWDKSSLTIETLKMNELFEWQKRSNVELVIAWKVPHKGWLFLLPKHLHKTPKSHSISLKDAFSKGIKLEALLGTNL